MATDEKVCPYCAETIKAAAVRCRYCHSDLDESLPASKKKPETPRKQKATATKSAKPAEQRAAAVTTNPKDIGDQDSNRGSLWNSWAVTAALAVSLCCVLVLAGLIWSGRDGSAVASESGPLTIESERTAVLAATADLTQRTLSYSYQSLDKDMEVAEAQMTPKFRKDYRDAMKRARANTVKNKISLQGTAVSASIISASKRRAETLVFVNQTTGSAASKNQQLDQLRLVVSLEKKPGGDWRIDKLNALG